VAPEKGFVEVKAAWEDMFVFVIVGRFQTERWVGVVGKGL